MYRAIAEETVGGLAREIAAAQGYELERPLGRGGVGEVFLVRSRTEPPTRYALKVLASRTTESERAFSREVEALDRHGNGHTVRLLKHGTEGAPWYLMEYFPSSLQAWMLENPAPRRNRAQALGYLRQALRALAEWHTQRPVVVHGDVNPSNVLVDPATGRAVLADPSLAFLRGPHGTGIGGPPIPGGTGAYRDPGGNEGRPAADVYGFGATLYATLVRRFELQLDGLAARAAADAEVPAPLRAIVARCLRADGVPPYAGCDEVLRDYEAALAPLAEDETPEAEPAGGSRGSAAYRTGLVVMAGLAVLGIVASHVLPQRVPRGSRPRDPQVATARLSHAASLPLPRSTPTPVTVVVRHGPSRPAVGPVATPAAALSTPAPARPPAPLAVPPRPLTAGDHVRIGEGAQAAGRLVEAEGAFRRALALDPDHPEAHRALGLLYRHIHSEAGAFDHLGRYLELRPDAPDRGEVYRMIALLEP